MLNGSHKSFKLKLKPAHVAHNVQHAGGLFDSFGDFVSGIYQGAVSVGKFILENGPAILDTVSSILPASSPQLIAAKAALSAASGIGRKLNDIRVGYERAEQAKDAAREKLQQEKQRALDKEIALREQGASRERLQKAKEESKDRLAKPKSEAKRVGKEALREKARVAEVQKKQLKVERKAESALKAAQKAADKHQAKH